MLLLMQNFSKKALGLIICLLLVGILIGAWIVFGQKRPSEVAVSPIEQTTDPAPTPKPTVTPATSGKPTQFVVMAFDGSRSLVMWQNTLDFAEKMKQQNTPVQFTYFLSGVYFLNYRNKNLYTPPQGKPGDSSIGFADSNLDVEKRVAFVNRAIKDGHEIGSHANGHYDGSKWGQKDWQQEFDAFDNLIFNIVQNNKVSPDDANKYTLNLKPNELVGFRAPDLGKNSAMLDALKNSGFTYDTSYAAKSDAWPTKTKNGLWEFPLATIKYASTTGNILSMDYNFYFKLSKAKDAAKQGDQLWTKFYNDTYTSYINYFDSNYNGNRAPVFIGSHFSEWNDGVYWQAMKDFAQTVCTKPEVRCVTFSELKNYLETNPIKQ